MWENKKQLSVGSRQTGPGGEAPSQLVDLLKCELSIKDSGMLMSEKRAAIEKNRLMTVVKDSRMVLEALLQDMEEVWLCVLGG